MRKFIIWRAQFEGPNLLEVEGDTPEEAMLKGYSRPHGLALESKEDTFGYGATCWDIRSTDDSLVEVTTEAQRVACALGCLHWMLEVSKDMQ